MATLNGTLTAMTRAIVAILETHQNEDGSVTRAAGAAPLPGRPRGLEPLEERARLTDAGPGWAPQVVALDIDGTLLKWVDGQTEDYETITAPVHDAVHRALDAGAHIVLSSGRSPHGMTRIADLLDLPREGADRLWIVASNGAVVFRYPPMEVVHEETFDAAPAVAAVLEHHPNALVAVEERGVGGYRVNRVFPEGELSGEQMITEVDDIVGEPVSRVIIRDPDATADDFIELAARLGLHGTDYVVGWTAWLDLTPGRRLEGVRAAARVRRELGISAADVLAIGDGRNDIEMLRWAGRGVAMGQAVEEVKAAARRRDRLGPRRGRRGRDRPAGSRPGDLTDDRRVHLHRSAVALDGASTSPTTPARGAS